MKGVANKLTKIYLEPAFEVFTMQEGIKQVVGHFLRLSDAVDFKHKLNECSTSLYQIGKPKKWDELVTEIEIKYPLLQKR